jgi:hypothetical protein
MKRYATMLIPALIALALLAIAPRAYSDGCGVVPIKPIPPIGCKDPPERRPPGLAARNPRETTCPNLQGVVEKPRIVLYTN